MDQFEITTDGETLVGPVTLDQVRRGIVAGKVPADARARLVGTEEWQPVALVLAASATESAEPLEQPQAVAPAVSPTQATPTGGLMGPWVIIVAGFFSLLVLVGMSVSSDDKSEPSKPTTKKLTPEEEASAKEKAARDEARRKAEVEAQRERAKREEEERAERVKRLRSKVKKKYWDEEPDGECTGKGLPPYRWDYEGGTYAEDEEVARADGCRKLHRTVELQTYCCPTKPSTF